MFRSRQHAVDLAPIPPMPPMPVVMFRNDTRRSTPLLVDGRGDAFPLLELVASPDGSFSIINRGNTKGLSASQIEGIAHSMLAAVQEGR